MDKYVALWHECETDTEKKLTEGEVDGKKMMKMKRIAKRHLTKQTKKDPESEETKKAQEKYDCLCSLHQKVSKYIYIFLAHMTYEQLIKEWRAFFNLNNHFSFML